MTIVNMKTLFPTIGLFLILASNAWAGGLHLRFERTYVDGEATKTPDWSGNGNHGTLVNAPTLVAGRTGRGMGFNGTSQRIDLGVGTVTGDLSGAAGITMSAWVYQTALSSDTKSVIGIPINETQTGGHLSVTALGDISVSGRSSWTDEGQGEIAENIVTAGVWIHLVGVLDFVAKTITIYADGQEVAAKSSVAFGATSYTLGTDDTDARIGMTPFINAARYFNGTIDEPIITPFAWTAEEVRAYYHSGEIPSRRAE